MNYFISRWEKQTLKARALIGENGPKIAIFVNALLLCFVGLIYVLCLPSQVQGGDTGEMAANPYAGRLLHPPGFPVFYWLARFATHVLPLDSVFTRGALLSVFTSLASLALLLSWKKVGPRLGLALTLAVSPTFWHYSVLPEVFLVQMPFLVAFLLLLEKERFIAATCFFALALGVHPQAIFLVPLWAWSLGRIRIVPHSSLLVSLVLLAYGSLAFIRSDSLYSWRDINSIEALLHHMLRFDYGALKLSAAGGSFFLLQHLLFFCSRNYAILLILIPITLLGWRNLNKHAKGLALSAFGFLLIFFSLANTDPILLAGEVVARFHIFPLLLLTLASRNAIDRVPKLGLLAFLLGIAQIALYFPENNFSKRKIIAEYATNLLRQTEPANCAILITQSDAVYVAANYLQTVEGVAPRVIVVAKGLLGLAVYRERLKNLGLKFGGVNEVPEDYVRDILLPNLSTCRIVAEYQDQTPLSGIRFLPVGREIITRPTVELGAGPELLISDEPDERLHYDVEKRLFARYADFFLMRSLMEEKSGELAMARKSLADALKIVPYCTFAWERLCSIDAKLGLESKLICELAQTKDPYCDPRRP